jgi:hypothetical protein
MNSKIIGRLEPNTFYKHLSFYIFGLMIFLTSSCFRNEKDAYLENFTSFVESTASDYKNYSEEDWKLSDEKFSTFTEIEQPKWESELTEVEKIKINQLKGRYLAIRLKSGIAEFENGLIDATQQMEGFINELKADSTN